MFSCKKSEDNPTPAPLVTPLTVIPADSIAITKFMFLQSDNNFSFGTDITATIKSDSILIDIPGDIDVTQLIPAITIKGKTVQPASGTAQDFTAPVTYTVTNSSGKTKSYIVNITLTGANELIIV
jgi:hypothetical protein